MALALTALLAAGYAFAAGNEDEDKNEAAAATNAEAKKRFAEGNERYARGDYDGAVESFKAAIAADPKLPGPYRNLGLAYRALNRCNDALPMYEKYLELKPESRFTERVRREIDLCRAKLGQTPLPPRQETHTVTGTPHAPEAQANPARRGQPHRRRGHRRGDREDRRPGARRDAADHPGHARRPQGPPVALRLRDRQRHRRGRRPASARTSSSR